MKLYYYVNEVQRSALHKAGLDYTPAYIPELLSFLGVSAEPLTPETLYKAEPDDVLFVGAEYTPELPDCNLILFGTAAEPVTAPTVRGTDIADYYVTADGKQLPLFVPMLPSGGGKVLRTTASGLPALTCSGKAVRFCFDLPATVWYSGDGFYTGVSPHGFFVGRTTDTRPLPPTMGAPDAYNDLLLGEIEEMLAAWNIPMLHRLPPAENGSVPDFALHFSGDNDCDSAELNRNATRLMEQAGLPYHINAMPMGGKYFVFDREILQELNARGCEIALHTDYIDDVPYCLENQKAQADLFEEAFGYRSLTNTNHYFVQDGPNYERLRWLEACGIIADNGKFGEINISDVGTGNMNAFNLWGFSFGTAFPRYTLDDPAHGNRHIDTMEIPISYYEPRLGGEYTNPALITNYLDNAAEYGRISNSSSIPTILTRRSPTENMFLQYSS